MAEAVADASAAAAAALVAAAILCQSAAKTPYPTMQSEMSLSLERSRKNHAGALRRLYMASPRQRVAMGSKDVSSACEEVCISSSEVKI